MLKIEKKISTRGETAPEHTPPAAPILRASSVLLFERNVRSK